MEIEKRIRDAVRVDGPIEPSGRFHDRVMATLPDRPPERAAGVGSPAGLLGRVRRVSPGLARAALAALIIVALGALVLGPRFVPAAGPEGGPTATPGETSAPETSEPSPTVATRHVSAGELGLDVPASWASEGFDLPDDLAHGLKPVLTVGTGDLAESCVNPTAEQQFAGHKEAICTAAWTLPAGGIQLRLVLDNRSGKFNGCCEGIYSVMTAAIENPPAGSEPIEIGGLQARVTRVQSNVDPLTGETISDAEEVIEYRLVAPQWPFFGYVVTAALRGPNLSELEAQVSAAMASLAYTPAIAPMPTDPASLKAALHSTLALIDSVNQCDGCQTRAEGFVDTPGATNTVTITRVAFDSNRYLLHPLKVRCTATIQPTGVDYWLVKLTYEWDATGKYRAGTATATYMVPRDMSSPLSVAPQAAPTNEDAMPYISASHAYNPG
jgi:hypothetical protein